jgi:putative aldouronate transport system permease protein
MVFRPGIIPNYLLIVNLQLTDSMWGVILPAVLVTFNMMVMRTFFVNFPSELEESGMMDGLNPFGVLGRIVLPLSKGIIATIILFYAVMFWNDWFRGLLYLRTNSKKPITLFLRGIIAGGGLDTSSMNFASKADEAGAVAENIKSATIILVALPIVMVYPYIQKYFVKGIMLGSLKG